MKTAGQLDTYRLARWVEFSSSPTWPSAEPLLFLEEALGTALSTTARVDFLLPSPGGSAEGVVSSTGTAGFVTRVCVIDGTAT